MISERVYLDLQNESTASGEGASTGSQLEVNAWYVLRNQGYREETIQVVYPLDAFNPCLEKNTAGLQLSYTFLDYFPFDFSVTVDGETIPATTLMTEHPYGSAGGCTEMRWAAFDVTFPIAQNVLIHITYPLRTAGAPDAVENFEVVLETGAGWFGGVSKAEVVLRLPYVVDDNILRGTTRGYQIHYNEITWTYFQMEPDRNRNLLVSFIESELWLNILKSRERIRKDSNDIEAYQRLAEAYSAIARVEGQPQRQTEYQQLAYRTYLRGIANNPQDVTLYLDYANLYLFDCCYNSEVTRADLAQILPMLDKALNLDPSNGRAEVLLAQLKEQVPDLNYQPPATLTPSVPLKPTRTVTPTGRPTQTSSPTPTASPTVTRQPTVTVTRQPARTPTAAAASTATLQATSTISSTLQSLPVTGVEPDLPISPSSRLTLEAVALSSLVILLLILVVIFIRFSRQEA